MHILSLFLISCHFKLPSIIKKKKKKKKGRKGKKKTKQWKIRKIPNDREIKVILRCTSTHRGNLWQWKVRWNKKSISRETLDCAANKYIPVPRNTSSRAKTDQWHRFIRVVARSIPIDEPRLQVGSIVGGMFDTYVRAEEYRGTRRRIENALEQRWMAGNVLNYRLLITHSVCSRSNSPTLSSRVFRFKDAERSRCRLIEPPSVIHGSFVNPIRPLWSF